MLSSLHIVDYALIDDLTVEFKPGLNIITGATGAGKSIIFGALGLALGEKAGDEAIRTDAQVASVEAEFYCSDKTGFPEADLIEDDHLIISREIKKNGRSRAFINNKQVTLHNLKAIGSVLTDITGQHRQKSLSDSVTHIQILDRYAGSGQALEELSRLFKEYIKIKARLEDSEKKQKDSVAEKELFDFQIKEIEAAALSANEDELLEKEKLQLVNAESIKAACRSCYDSFFEDDGAAAERLKNAIKELERIARFADRAKIIKDKIEELSINLDEGGIMIRDLADSFEFDPARLEIVEERLTMIKKLKRKYGQSISEILRYAEQAKTKATAYENLEADIKLLAEDMKRAQSGLSQKAIEVSQKRKSAAMNLQKVVKKHLADLAMEGADFKVLFTGKESTEGPFIVGSQKLAGTEHGFDEVEFLICPNPGEKLKPLASTASGGELSRILLAICSALAEAFPTETLIFDEIDAGISGEVASQVGKKLKKLGEKRQVICITHLQQIASQGKAHFKVYKGKSGGRSVTRIKELEGDQRVAEIARLLAGEQISEVAIEGALKLLEEGRSSNR